eukprot:gb/GECG01006994.1/.p1 GENE.gb/GECG01006994.1/~~gb/GECG01006994.1/.p1  ORF type:complete len:172 (+),score=13.78 gb/GECG01006994.1/:1-516(+)
MWNEKCEKILKKQDSATARFDKLKKRIAHGAKCRRTSCSTPHSKRGKPRLSVCSPQTSFVLKDCNSDWKVSALRDSSTKQSTCYMTGGSSSHTGACGLDLRGELLFDAQYLASLQEYLQLSESIVEVLINHLSTLRNTSDKSHPARRRKLGKATLDLTVCQPDVSMSVQPR